MNSSSMKAIMYHYVRPFDEALPNFKNLHIDDFEKQLDFFEKEFGFVSKADFINSLKTGIPTTGVILTFDDGFRDHFQYVFPVLKRRNLWGIFYITTGVYASEEVLDVHKIHLLLGKIPSKELFEALQEGVFEEMLSHKNVTAFNEATYQLQNNDDYTNLIKRTLNYYLDYQFRTRVIDELIGRFFHETPSQLFLKFYVSKEELKIMADAGMILGSHTVNHPVMSKLPLQEQKKEILGSFSFLESVTEKLPIKTFCYPYGGFHSFTSETRKLLNDQEVLFSFNVEERAISSKDLKQNRQALPRFDCNQFPHGSCRTSPIEPFISIAGRKIGREYKPLVIAEIGINHEGSLVVAKEMVDAAHRAGVEVVKHQTHIVADEMSGAAKKVIPGNADVSIYEIMERCSLNEADERALKEYIEQKGMIFISTPFSRAAANRLEAMDVQGYKIGSGECNNYPLLEHIAGFGKPVILSTGMNTIESVRKAVEIFDRYKVPLALLHTTNLYPTPPHLVRFGAMTQLQEAFSDKVFGLSDHTLNNNACLGAVALGASILERHFTDYMQRKGPDIVCSMDETECANLIHASEEIWRMRGGTKEPAKEEQITIDFAFATVCAIQPIKKGEHFTAENIWVKRPGTGEVLAEKYNEVLGKKAAKDIENDVQLTKEDIAL
jgi:sialic acid synthase SpsE/peptidoglycan/xylan/chitin deacetylase (PgdA/CDA1 family)